MDYINVKLSPEALLPTRKHEHDAGLDLFTYQTITLQPNQIAEIDTGVAFEIPPGVCMRILPKGRSDYVVLAGVVDSGYSNTVVVKILNPLPKILRLYKGQAIAQAVIFPILTPIPRVTDDLYVDQETRKNDGLFGKEI